MKRKIYLLSMLLVASQISYSQDDELKNYTYLLLSVKATNQESVGQNQSIAVTGFSSAFLVQRNNRILLVSAYHVLTGIDVYQNRFYPNFDYFLLRYMDKDKNVRYKRIDKQLAFPIISTTPEFLSHPDVAVCEIDTNDFKVKPVFNFVPDELFNEKKTKAKRKHSIDSTVIIYGFSNYPSHLPVSQQLLDEIQNLSPYKYEGAVADSEHEDDPFYEGIDKVYHVLQPKEVQGSSGAPAFCKYTIYRNGKQKKTWIRFLGVQSGTNHKYNSAYVVRKEYVEDKIPK